MTINIGHILTHSSQRQNDTGVFGRLCIMEPSVLVNVLLNKLDNCVIVTVRILQFSARANKANDHPFTANTTGNRCTQIFQVITGGIVNFFHICQRFQHCQFCLCGLQICVILYKRFLKICQIIIGVTGSFDLLLTVRSNYTNRVNQFFNFFRCFLILRICLQQSKIIFCISQLFIVTDQLLLIRCECIISLPGCSDFCFAVQRNLFIDLIDQYFYRFCLFLIVSLLQFCKLGFCIGQFFIVLDLLFLSISQCIICLTGSFDLIFAVQSNCANGIDQLFNCLSSSFIPIRKALAACFLGVIIGIVENDYIAFLYRLLRNTQIGMDTIESIHPTGITAVGEFTDTVNRLHIITGGILPTHTSFLQCLFQHILDRCTGLHLVSLCGNPCA